MLQPITEWLPAGTTLTKPDALWIDPRQVSAVLVNLAGNNIDLIIGGVQVEVQVSGPATMSLQEVAAQIVGATP